ncbi:MAG: AAA family ATPase [Oscillospiraceae bacterium]
MITTKEQMEELLADVKSGKPLDLTAHYFSVGVLQALNQRGAFPANQWNQFNGENDCQFLVNMLLMAKDHRTPTPAQQRKIGAVLSGVAKMLKMDTADRAKMKTVWAQERAKKDSEKPKLMTVNDLTTEQQELIAKAKNGENVLVDACIGSGKTTTIQVLCSEMKDKRILYLTYNTLLKLDAKQKTQNFNAQVTNYHGYVYGVLINSGIKVGISDLIQQFNKLKPDLPKKFDLIILDEYQDIELEIAKMLQHIKNQNSNVQVVAVGDMQQKIYDKTTLNVPDFIDEFLGEYHILRFTKCFRLNKEHAAMLGRIWGKEIDGINQNCQVKYMNEDEVVSYLSKQNPADILCLGARTGSMSDTLNKLEDSFPDVFNKNTVYASIADEDRQSVSPSNETAIFTTYDSSKGLERKICVVFDFYLDYWIIRLKKPMTSYSILRNVFCVAASRGKNEIIFVTSPTHALLTEEMLLQGRKQNHIFSKPFPIADMFSFKYKEDIEECYRFLKIKKLETKESAIKITSHDGLIDISPCIGIFQEVNFFHDYNIEDTINFTAQLHNDRTFRPMKEATLEEKILYVTMMETNQERYVTQVKTPFISDEQASQIYDRLGTVFNGNETVQQDCEIEFYDEYDNLCTAKGRVDVVKGDIIYELKFVSELNIYGLHTDGNQLYYDVSAGLPYCLTAFFTASRTGAVSSVSDNA